MEWSVTAGIIGAAVLAFLIGTDRLPLFLRKPANIEVAQ
jgi:hypothetical protein